jgi:AAA family ATP:ADP antiporter
MSEPRPDNAATAGESRNDPVQALLKVQPGERAALAFSFAYFFFVLASYYVLRPIRDAMGVAGGVDDLPWLFLGTLTATVLLSPVFSALVARMPRRRFVAWSYRVLMLCLVGFYVALETLPDSQHVWVGRAFFVWVSVFNLFAVSLFWAVMADVFTTAQAKRLFGLIGAGGTLGGLAGGLVTASLAERIGAEPLLLVSVVLLELAFACMVGASSRAARDRPEQAAIEREVIGGDTLAGFRSALRSPYLLGICVFMLLFTVGSTFLYFLQGGIAAEAFPERGARTAFFARVDVWVNGLTLLIQLGFTGRIMRRLGVGATLALLPAISVIGYLGLAAAPVVTAVVVFQVVRRTADFALSRPAREVLYVPLGREDKYKAKNLIDTFVYRAGDQIGAWTHAGLLALGLGVTGISLVAAPLSMAWFVLALWLGRRHATMRDTPPQSRKDGEP